MTCVCFHDAAYHLTYYFSKCSAEFKYHDGKSEKSKMASKMATFFVQ